MIKVSILVPIYGVEKYIEKCAVSLMEQTYQDIEYVFVNDCTKDNSISILNNVIKRYPSRQTQVKIVNHEHNKGLAGARITALANATGDYIMHVDSDDWLDSKCIEKVVACAIKTNADIIDGAYTNIFESYQSIVKPWSKDKHSYICAILGGTGKISNQIWGRLIKRDLYLNHGINAVEGINFGEDYSVLPRLLYYAKREYIDDVIYCYNHTNESSYMNNINQGHFDMLCRAKQIVYDFYSSQPDFKKYRFSSNFGILNLYRYSIQNHLNNAELSVRVRRLSSSAILKLYLLAIEKHAQLLSKILFHLISSLCFSKL